MNGCSKVLCPMQVGCADNCKLTKKECPYFTAISGYQEMVAEIKEEAAREIFDEIIALCNNAEKNLDILFTQNDKYRKGYENSVKHFKDNMIKLQKKYTESEDDKQ